MSVPWWSPKYNFRKNIKITAGAANLPVNTPVLSAIDVGALVTALKVRSDKNDARIVYWNGSTYTDLFRDYVATTSMIFSLQAQINAAANDAGYYLYYGSAGEVTSKQPSSNSDYLKVYSFFGTSPDANTYGIWVPRAVGESTLTDMMGLDNGTYTGSLTVNTDGPFGRYITFNGSSSNYIDFGNVGNLSVTSGGLTIEALVNTANSGSRDAIFTKWDVDSNPTANQYELMLNLGATTQDVEGNYESNVSTRGSTPGGNLSSGVWTWVATAWNGSIPKIFSYLNGSEVSNSTATEVKTALMNGGTATRMGKSGDVNSSAKVSVVRFSNTARTSFPYTVGLTNPPTMTYGSEERIGVGGFIL